jgi:RluA family pseudouridine synthase
MRSWIVREGEAGTVAEIVARAAPEDARAVGDGRVFIGRKRAVAGSDAVKVGDEVTIAEPAAEQESVRILAHGDGWAAVDKPSGLPTIPDQGGASHALIALAARALSLPVSTLHATSRLDRDVSGVVVFALNAQATDRLHRARAEHRYQRRYLALAAKAPATDAGTWDVPIGRAKDPRHRAPNGRDATLARTHFAVVARAPAPSTVALLAFAPVTGRTHQIRVHASHAGAPLLGDRTYGGPSRATLPTGRVLAFDRIMLHAARVTVDGHVIDSAVPEKLRALWLALGGEDGAWEKALTWSLAAQ